VRRFLPFHSSLEISRSFQQEFLIDRKALFPNFIFSQFLNLNLSVTVCLSQAENLLCQLLVSLCDLAIATKFRRNVSRSSEGKRNGPVCSEISLEILQQFPDVLRKMLTGRKIAYTLNVNFFLLRRNGVPGLFCFCYSNA